MEILNPKTKEIVFYKSMLFLVLSLIIYFLNPTKSFNAILSLVLLFFACFIVFKTYKTIIVIDEIIFVKYLWRPFFRQKKINVIKIKFIWFKLDNLTSLNLPCISFFSFQFPFFFDLYVNSIEDVALIISKVNLESNPRIKASKARLDELKIKCVS